MLNEFSLITADTITILPVHEVLLIILNKCCKKVREHLQNGDMLHARGKYLTTFGYANSLLYRRMITWEDYEQFRLSLSDISDGILAPYLTKYSDNLSMRCQKS